MKKTIFPIVLMATLALPLSAMADRKFVFDPNNLRWYAVENGEVVNSGRASGGKDYCPDTNKYCRTPSGRFNVYRMGSADCVSSKFPVDRRLPRARTPYCMFFQGGYAIHGSDDVPDHNASHGCIRVTPDAAEWLRYNFMSPGTSVVVIPYYGS